MPGGCSRFRLVRLACWAGSTPRACSNRGTRRHDNGRVRPRVWLWPNLLSLDAPLVAVLWQVLFVRCFHAQGAALPAVLLVCAVWLIYAADRALDAWRGAGSQPRHEFYRRYWRIVLPVWSGVLV